MAVTGERKWGGKWVVKKDGTRRPCSEHATTHSDPTAGNALGRKWHESARAEKFGIDADTENGGTIHLHAKKNYHGVQGRVQRPNKVSNLSRGETARLGPRSRRL